MQQKISKPIKTSQKDHLFYNTVLLKKPHSFYESQLFWNWKKTCSQNTAKKLSQFTNFPANMFLFGVRKIICTTPFPDDQELLSWSTLKANVCIFLFIPIAFCFKDVARFYLVVWRGGWGGGGGGCWRKLNNFLKAARCLGLLKCFTIAHFNWNFSKFNYFLVFRYFQQ